MNKTKKIIFLKKKFVEITLLRFEFIYFLFYCNDKTNLM